MLDLADLAAAVLALVSLALLFAAIHLEVDASRDRSADALFGLAAAIGIVALYLALN